MNKTISLPDELLEKVEKHAYESGRTFSGVVRVCLERYVENVQEQVS